MNRTSRQNDGALESTETVTPPFAHFAERLGLPRRDARSWRAPGLALRPHGLGQHPRQSAERERTRSCGRPGEAASRGSGDTSACHYYQERHGQPGRYGSTAKRCPGRPCAASLHTTWPRASPGATRSGAALGPVPAGPSSSILAPSPLEGRACGPGACGPCPEPGTGKRPGGYAELTSFGWTPLVAISPVPPGPRAGFGEDPLEDSPARGMRGCSYPRDGWSLSWPGDLVRAGLGR
jgi:hypothetical protein